MGALAFTVNALADDCVVIIGGGLAGLTSLDELVREGKCAELYEADDRVGGRVKTVHDGIEPELITNAGAELVDSTHTHMLAKMKEVGVRAIPRSADDHFSDGHFFYKDEVIPSEDLNARIRAESKDALEELVKNQIAIEAERKTGESIGREEFGPFEAEVDDRIRSRSTWTPCTQDRCSSLMWKHRFRQKQACRLESSAQQMLFEYMQFSLSGKSPCGFFPITTRLSSLKMF